MSRDARAPLRQRIAATEDEVARWRLRADQLVIVDEASLAGTFALDELVGAAATPGPRSSWSATRASSARSKPGAPSPPWCATAKVSPPN